jgi:D-serine deaminase-like pyridoxal phosphate-dependent protein
VQFSTSANGTRPTTADFPSPSLLKVGQHFKKLGTDYEVVHLNDHHARFRTPESSELSVGDLVGCHISHPCTSFDSWRLIPLVDREHTVIDAIRSYL